MKIQCFKFTVTYLRLACEVSYESEGREQTTSRYYKFQVINLVDY